MARQRNLIPSAGAEFAQLHGHDFRIAPAVIHTVAVERGWPSHAKITAIDGFSSEAIGDWASRHLPPGSEVLSDGLACFRAAATADCSHEAVVTSGKQPIDLPEFRWINS